MNLKPMFRITMFFILFFLLSFKSKTIASGRLLMLSINNVTLTHYCKSNDFYQYRIMNQTSKIFSGTIERDEIRRILGHPLDKISNGQYYPYITDIPFNDVSIVNKNIEAMIAKICEAQNKDFDEGYMNHNEEIATSKLFSMFALTYQ